MNFQTELTRFQTAFHASFNEQNSALADSAVLKVSRGTSVILLLVYILYLVFQLRSHAYLYESTPQEVIDEESHPGVLADIMNSSSSSDDSSSTDSSDSDTSGSIITTGKKIRKKMFKHRRRRKSSASSTTASVVPSALSSPSTNESQGNYWEHQVGGHPHRESALGVIASENEGDADQEEGRHNIMPRIRDFVHGAENVIQGEEAAKAQGRKKSKRNHKKHHKRHRHDKEKEAVRDPEKAGATQGEAATDGPRVGFADDMVRMESPEEIPTSQSQPNSLGPEQSPGKRAFNMRQLSSRVAYRPALPKMLSNTVFTTPPPPIEPIRRPAPAPRSRSTGGTARRASSLPDLNRKTQSYPRTWNTTAISTIGRTDPLPPFQHQRSQVIRKTNSEDVDDSEEEVEEKEQMTRTAAVVLLLVSTGLVAACAEFMVDAIPAMLESSPGISEAFIGLIILPIVGNAAEHVTAVLVATKNKMDLAIGVAVGSSIQIALFVTPIVVLLGWIMHTDMSLYFNLFETVSLFVTAFVVNFLVLDGRSNYLEGSLLIASYVIIAVGAFFYPSDLEQSDLGGAGTD